MIVVKGAGPACERPDNGSFGLEEGRESCRRGRGCVGHVEYNCEKEIGVCHYYLEAK